MLSGQTELVWDTEAYNIELQEHGTPFGPFGPSPGLIIKPSGVGKRKTMVSGRDKLMLLAMRRPITQLCREPR